MCVTSADVEALRICSPIEILMNTHVNTLLHVSDTDIYWLITGRSYAYEGDTPPSRPLCVSHLLTLKH